MVRLDRPVRGTFATVLTGEGRGAIAVVRVWGTESLAVADAVFRPRQGSPLAATPPDRPRVGRVGAGLGDEVVAIVCFEKSGVEVEIQCHGGTVATTLVLDALILTGARVVPAEFWLRQHAESRIKAEARWSLKRVSTLRTAEILLDQARGALDDAFDRLKQPSSIDRHPEVEILLDRSRLGLRLLKGWRVVLAGRPNVGKSRLLNALAGFDRVIVDPTPGTTRDVVTTRTAFDGWPVELSDTAGLRQAEDGIEAIGVSLARARQAEADLVLLVLDRSEAPTESDLGLIDQYPHALVVANKCDLPAAWEPPGIPISAEQGQGIEALIQAIAARLVPDPPPPGAAVPFRPWQVRWLQRRSGNQG